MEYIAVFALLAGIVIGINIENDVVMGDVEGNHIKGYHCQPITTHNTLEEAKARVIEYQERVK